MNSEHLKESVRQYWNQASCGTWHTAQHKFSRAYFEEIEAYRYGREPEIFSFAQFTRAHGKKVLEVGIGAGTDFLQWVRAGAQAYGIDLTQEAIDNVTQRLELYGLKAREVRVADAEQLPYADNFFDLTYSWGVIHHSPNTVKCLEEIIRVTKPGGTIKIMIYNRYSVYAFYHYVRSGLLKGKLQSLRTFLFYHQESLGTKAYTFGEVRRLLERYPVRIVKLTAPFASSDFDCFKRYRVTRWCAYLAACIIGWQRSSFFMTIQLEKR